MNGLKRLARWIKGLRVFDFLRRDKVKRAIIATVIYLAALILVLMGVMPQRYNLKAGDVAPVNIIAPKDIVDRVETEKLIERARESVKVIYTRDHTIPIKVKSSIEEFFHLVAEVRSQPDISVQEKINRLRQNSAIQLEDKDYETCLQASEDELSSLKQNILDVTNQIMSVGVTPDALDRSRREAGDFFSKQAIRQGLKDLGYNLSSKVIRPNMLPDTEGTQKDIDIAVSQVEPVVIHKGQNIVSRGEGITEAHIELLKASGLLKEGLIDIRLAGGYALLVFVLQLLTVLYIRHFHNRIYENTGNLLLIGLITVMVLFISLGINVISSYLIPTAAIPMLIAVLLDPRVAVMVNFAMAVLVGLMAGSNDISVMIVAMTGGLVGALKMMGSNQRRDLFISGILVGVSNAIVILSTGLLMGRGLLDITVQSSWGLLNGGFAAVLTIGTLPIWENLFDIITPLKLMELANPNQPLLKELLLKAPGTYHHSIIVGNLAEYAAQEIGANALLARVGAYYHDIGKIRRPYFFNENQMISDNPHDKITPSLSTLIITSHVKDGVEMAEKHRIPVAVRDIIRQHHGDSLLVYFYHKARQGENSHKVTEDSFRYEGPRPQTREAAIVMLADCVEAAVRAMTDHSAGKMEGHIRKIIKERLDNGQLDECDLTLKDLDIIANAFSSILGGIFHQRIEYPEINGQSEGLKKDDGTDRKQTKIHSD